MPRTQHGPAIAAVALSLTDAGRSLVELNKKGSQALPDNVVFNYPMDPNQDPRDEAMLMWRQLRFFLILGAIFAVPILVAVLATR